MAQQSGGSRKGSGSSGRSRAKSSSSKAKSTSSRSKSASARSASSRSSSKGPSAAKRKAAAKKGGQARARQQKARKTAKTTSRTAGRAASSAGVEAKTVAEFRESLRKNLIRPLDLVMLTRDRIEEVLEDAVDRGRMTSADAQTLANGLIQRGRKQTNDVMRDLEQLVGRGSDAVGARVKRPTRGARTQVEGAARGARKQAVKAADPVLAQADRVRRAAGVGPSFPITGYDDLTAAQIQGRLTDLTPAELRKVRDYERRNANRKSVLNSIETKLG
jgi:polyhydroxyalkanoate synthesis regulator phasin